MFETNKKYKIEYEKELFDGNKQVLTYTGKVISTTEYHVTIETIRNEKVTLRLSNIPRWTELKEEYE
jgi:hypothetical protein